MDSRDQRIATLAATLKSSGIAKSEAQAKMMAEDMVGVEDKVQKNYEERHAAAHEHLSTSKHLGNAKVISQPAQAPVQENPKVLPIKNVPSSAPIVQNVQPSEKTIDARGVRASNDSAQINITSGRVDSHDSHNTHNSLIEMIKAEVSQQKIVPLYDQYMESIGEPVAPKQEQAQAEEKSVQFDPVEEPKVIEQVKIEVYDVEEHAQPGEIEVQKVEEVQVTLEEQKIPDHIVDHLAESKIEIVEIEEPVSETVAETKEEPVAKLVEEIETVSQNSEPEAPKLDGQKLAELMAEDGPMEEHTRQLPPKPEVVRPKESFEENGIDLGSVFKFKR
ncbi:MAG TPA: hypothetical protein VEC16_00905 [Alphaproteobacteria bacterium]|nr:hypothetical protein [Alphaproteobacteria bacterium]